MTLSHEMPRNGEALDQPSDLLLVRIAPWVQYRGEAAIPRTGVEFPHALSFEKWLQIGKMLSIVRTSSAWYLGDWLIYGETAYSGRYRDAIKQTALDYQTLRNYAWVARRFPLSRRRETLAFGHHAEVASLPEPEQDFWLRKAESLSWSTSRLRREVRTSLRERAVAEKERQGSQPGGQTTESNRGGGPAADATSERQRLDLLLHIPLGQYELYQVAADAQGLTLESWAVSTLYNAASVADD